MSGEDTPVRLRRAPISHHTLLFSAGIVIALLLLVFGIESCSYHAPTAAGHTTTSTPSSGLPTVRAADLPPEARAVLTLIDKGGPFPYKQDDTVFGNNEGRLPTRPRGYYREYTVPTPGSSDRGARRLIAGQDGDIYYTSDHYDTFRQVRR